MLLLPLCRGSLVLVDLTGLLGAGLACLVVAHRRHGHLGAGGRRGRHPTTVTPARTGRRHTRLHRNNELATTISSPLSRTRHLRRATISFTRDYVRTRRTESREKQANKRDYHRFSAQHSNPLRHFPDLAVHWFTDSLVSLCVIHTPSSRGTMCTNIANLLCVDS